MPQYSATSPFWPFSFMFQVKILCAFLYPYASYAFFHIVRRYRIPTVKIRIVAFSICFCYSRSFRFIFSFSEPTPNLHIRNTPSKFQASKNYVHVLQGQFNRRYLMSRIISVILSAISLSTCTPSSHSLTPR